MREQGSKFLILVVQQHLVGVRLLTRCRAGLFPSDITHPRSEQNLGERTWPMWVKYLAISLIINQVALPKNGCRNGLKYLYLLYYFSKQTLQRTPGTNRLFCAYGTY